MFNRGNNNNNKDNNGEDSNKDADMIEVKIGEVRPLVGSSIVFLRLVSSGLYLPITIGEQRSEVTLNSRRPECSSRRLTQMPFETLVNSCTYSYCY